MAAAGPPPEELAPVLRERLAELLHERFCETMVAQGYRPGRVTSERDRTHSALLPYRALPEDEKEQNRSSVADIPRKLAVVGYRIVPAHGGEPPLGFPPDVLERLAEQEHDRWMLTKLHAGWRYAERTDKPNRRHASLVPWRSSSEEQLRGRFTAEEITALGPGELSDGEREKDREVVRGLPALLAQVGYAIVRR